MSQLENQNKEIGLREIQKEGRRIQNALYGFGSLRKPSIEEMIWIPFPVIKEFGPFYNTLPLEEKNKAVKQFEETVSKHRMNNKIIKHDTPEDYDAFCIESCRCYGTEVTRHDLKVMLRVAIKEYILNNRLWDPEGKMYRFPQMNSGLVIPFLVYCNFKILPLFGCTKDQVSKIFQFALSEIKKLGPRKELALLTGSQ